jgi:putative FmdB family regulatory protein
MPHYDYHCDNCQHELELFQKMTDPVETKCPKCGKDKLRRKISGGAGIIFKGSGFYATDYKNKEIKLPDVKQRAAQIEKANSE